MVLHHLAAPFSARCASGGECAASAGGSRAGQVWSRRILVGHRVLDGHGGLPGSAGPPGHQFHVSKGTAARRTCCFDGWTAPLTARRRDRTWFATPVSVGQVDEVAELAGRSPAAEKPAGHQFLLSLESPCLKAPVAGSCRPIGRAPAINEVAVERGTGPGIACSLIAICASPVPREPAGRRFWHAEQLVYHRDRRFVG